MKKSNRFWFILIASIAVVYGALYWIFSGDLQFP
ncbi:hypothetical protein BleG1_3234 [Shouchella lehensis G1]|uniref:Uncharacterized protein n=1 Tax=Shouchella lehensis G1 TaxID=1246626 RepID=A0A060LWY2_9BACI|nr:hypothetical protein BleG1_3234 [Shouchella lehensis G1]